MHLLRIDSTTAVDNDGLHAPVVTFGDGFDYLPSKKDNVDSGALRAKAGMTFELTVRAAAARFDLDSENEEPAFRVDFDNSSVATGAAVTGDNRYLLTAGNCRCMTL